MLQCNRNDLRANAYGAPRALAGDGCQRQPDRLHGPWSVRRSAMAILLRTVDDAAGRRLLLGCMHRPGHLHTDAVSRAESCAHVARRDVDAHQCGAHRALRDAHRAANSPALALCRRERHGHQRFGLRLGGAAMGHVLQ